MTPAFLPFVRRAAIWAVGLAALAATALPASATNIERVVSRGGIEAWLVRESSVPLIAMNFALRAGSSQDPAEKAGLANLAAALLDEGAGDLDARTFHERLESRAIELSFSAGRDHLSGSLRTLLEHRAEAAHLLKLALAAPRFDAEAVERVRSQILAGLRRETMNPNELANKRWWAAAFPGHPYGRPTRGTLDTVPAITTDDLKAYARLFARDTLKIGIVGNIDAAEAGALVDEVFGALPARAELAPVPATYPHGIGEVVRVDLDVPQSALVLGRAGIARRDPDFFAAYIVNHILGGGSFSSRLYREVREARGLAYSVYSSLLTYDHAALFMSATATRADRADETMRLIESEIRRLAQNGPTVEELAKAKSYLKGSYPLQFDTSTKIAAQLVRIQIDELGIDYIKKRDGLIEAVTLDDVKRVSKRLLDGGLLVAVAGRASAVAAKTTDGGEFPADRPAAAR
jgi:zinc protease